MIHLYLPVSGKSTWTCSINSLFKGEITGRCLQSIWWQTDVSGWLFYLRIINFNKVWSSQCMFVVRTSRRRRLINDLLSPSPEVAEQQRSLPRGICLIVHKITDDSRVNSWNTNVYVHESIIRRALTNSLNGWAARRKAFLQRSHRQARRLLKNVLWMNETPVNILV